VPQYREELEPVGVGNQNRANWAKELDIPVAGTGELGEYLFWVGCAGSFDDRNQKVSKAIVACSGKRGHLLDPGQQGEVLRRPGPPNRQ